MEIQTVENIPLEILGFMERAAVQRSAKIKSLVDREIAYKEKLRNWEKLGWLERLFTAKPCPAPVEHVSDIALLTLLEIKNVSPFRKFSELPTEAITLINSVDNWLVIPNLISKLDSGDGTKSWDSYESHYFLFLTKIPFVALEVSGTSCRYNQTLDVLRFTLRQS